MICGRLAENFSLPLSMKKFFATSQDKGLFLLRVGAGAAMLPFGLAKIGIIGDVTLAQSLQFFASMGIPSFIGVLVIIAETVGAVSLIAGFCTRFCSASLAVIMVGAIIAGYGSGYFVGYVSPLLFLIMLLSLTIDGAGAWSLDLMISKKKRK